MCFKGLHIQDEAGDKKMQKLLRNIFFNFLKRGAGVFYAKGKQVAGGILFKITTGDKLCHKELPSPLNTGFGSR